MASEAKSRKAFITSTIELAQKYGFDGMDLDWDSPRNPKQMQDLGLLFMEWREAINYEAKTTHRAPLFLTATVYFSADIFLDEVYRKYPDGTLQRWAHAALYDPNSNMSTSYGIRSWIKAGLSKDKLVMGLPLYGRSWQLKDPNSHEIGLAAVAVGPGEDGVLTYAEIEDFNNKNGAKVVHDMETVSTYSYSGLSWVGYDDAVSTTLKIGFAQALEIRGYFFWTLSFDSEWKISRQASRAWVLG
ncbi:hypothetical protein PTKIN_Ptkin03bG0191500 [Pterospermum kingtungense]